MQIQVRMYEPNPKTYYWKRADNFYYFVQLEFKYKPIVQ